MNMLDAEEAELAVDTLRASAAGNGGTGGAPRELIDARAFVKLVFGVAYGVSDEDSEDDTLLCDGCGCRCELAPVPKVDVDGCLSGDESGCIEGHGRGGKNQKHSEEEDDKEDWVHGECACR